jgi:peptidoglycan-associated lipoprotein
MTASNELQDKKKLKFLPFGYVNVLFVFTICFFLVSCSSINLDEETSQRDVGTAAPIEDIKKGKNPINPRQEKSNIIELPIKPLGYDTKKRIDEKMLLYKSYEPSIYFDYDDFKIKQQYQELIKITYELMQLNPQYILLIEGHSDERGTTEYNLALGQKRAEAVVRAMEQLGATRNRIDAISFGEEKPIAIGSSSKAWEKNRRVDLTLK